MSPRLTILVSAALMAATVGAAPAVAQPPDAKRQPITVGSVTLQPCATSDLAWCTTVQVPFDYTDPSAGTTGVYFEWFPAGGAAQGTVLTVQGGPGYASTDYRDDYLEMLGPVAAQRNTLIIDLRGTGRSDAVTCTSLQNWKPSKGNQAYIDAVGACGRQLNSTRKRPDGSFVHAADLYSTANAARDVATLLGRLALPKIDLYGDSYGTYFSQVFTSRYAHLLRSVTLDAAYPVLGADPFYPDAIVRMRAAFNLACHRSAACEAATSGQSWSRISTLAAALRSAPLVGDTRDPAGTQVTVTVDVDALIQLVGIAGYDSGVYRELDPAVRAYLDGGDAAPLLRLTAQEIDDSDSGAVKEFSAGLYSANFCNDYPQPFSYSATNAQRSAQYAAAVAAQPANRFAPFTVDEWVSSPAEEFDSCLKWPAPLADDPPITAGTPIAPASLPVMVFSGELDSLTTPAEGQRVAAQMGPSARWIQVANMIHVSAMGDFVGCAAGLVQSFIAKPAKLFQLDASCADRQPEVRVVGTFPKTMAQATPAESGPGDHSTAADRRLAAVAAQVVGDAVWHWWYIPATKGHGLRGGTWKIVADGDAYALTFTNVRFTDDTTVSGTGTWDQVSGHVTASLTATGPGGRQATFSLSYDDYEPLAQAQISGVSGGAALVAHLPAP